MVGLVILMLAVLGGWYLWSRLKQLEIEIRRDIEEKNRHSEVEPEPEPAPEPEADRSVMQARATVTPPQTGEAQAAAGDAAALQDRLLSLVAAEPGLLQTELYRKLPDQAVRVLQAELLNLSRSGRLRREKAGGSYRLFPA